LEPFPNPSRGPIGGYLFSFRLSACLPTGLPIVQLSEIFHPLHLPSAVYFYLFFLFLKDGKSLAGHFIRRIKEKERHLQTRKQERTPLV
jgi:hypothetical protein